MSMAPKTANRVNLTCSSVCFFFVFQKLFIIGVAIIGVVSCQGWSKDENGYKYPKPQSRFDRPVEQAAEAPLEETDVRFDICL